MICRNVCTWGCFWFQSALESSQTASGHCRTHFSEGFSAGPEMIRGVRASSIKIESTSSMMQKLNSRRTKSAPRCTQHTMSDLLKALAYAVQQSGCFLLSATAVPYLFSKSGLFRIQDSRKWIVVTCQMTCQLIAILDDDSHSRTTASQSST